MIENRLLDDILPIDPPRPAGAIAAIKDAMLLRWHVFISGYPVVLNCKTTGSLEQAIDRLEQRENFDPKSLICSGITKATRPRWCWWRALTELGFLFRCSADLSLQATSSLRP